MHHVSLIILPTRLCIWLKHCGKRRLRVVLAVATKLPTLAVVGEFNCVFSNELLWKKNRVFWKKTVFVQMNFFRININAQNITTHVRAILAGRCQLAAFGREA